MRTNISPQIAFTLGVIVFLTSGLAYASGDETVSRDVFRKGASFFDKVINPPDYVKGGEWSVNYLKQWHAAPPPPVAVAPTGDVYIASEGHVQYFSDAGAYRGEWEFPDYPFRFGYFGLAIAPDRTVFVADHSAGHVYGFTPQGRLVSEWEATVGPLAAGPGGDIYASTGRRIQRFDADGALLNEWGPFGERDAEFGLALYLTVGPDGTIYVLDFDSGSVQRFTSEGSYLMRWEPGNGIPGRDMVPRGIFAGPDGNVYVFENLGGDLGCRLDCFTAAGSFLGSLDLPENRGTVYGPGIAIAPDGAVYISDRYNHRICYYKPSRIYYVIRYAVLGVFTVAGIFVIAVLVRFSLRKLKRRAAR
jgi:DNA-binding beta-propeller fold protein YncE